MRWESQQRDQLRYLLGPIKGLELVHPNIYPMDELQEYMKGQGLQIPNYKIAKT